jgi:glycerophosphoryl diester phosphodiesterase
MFRKRWFRRGLLWFVVAIAVAVVAFFVDRSLTRRSGEKRYAAAVAHLDATDPRWRYDEIDVDLGNLPDDQNGALLIPKFRSALTNPNPFKLPFLATDLTKDAVPNHVLADGAYEELNAGLVDNKEALAVALTFADRPQGLRRYTLTPLAFDTRLPDVQDTRPVVRMLDVAAEQSGRDGRGGAALRYIEPMLNAGRSLSREPFLICSLVRMGCVGLAVKRVERTLGLATPRSQLPALQATLLQESKSDFFWHTLRGDRAVMDRTFSNLRDGTVTLRDIAQSGDGPSLSDTAAFEARLSHWFYEPNLANDHATFLEILAETYHVRHLPEHEQREALRKIEGQFRDLPSDARLTRLLTPSFQKIHEASQRTRAHLRCAAVGIAVERFRLASGRWPHSLDEIPNEILAGIPRDPFDGQPLKYAQRDDGVTVYSIGVDGRDDGGTIKVGEPSSEPGQDVAFRLYNPDRRGLPAVSRPSPPPLRLAVGNLVFEPDDETIYVGPEPREVEGKDRTTDQPVRAPPVEIIGHRGASFDAPENTVASIRLAWDQKADAAEFDVHLSKDGKIVVIHDANTKRTAGVDKRVVDQTLHELRTLDVGKWKDARYAGENVPTLAEVLGLTPPGKRVFIEVKCGREIVPELKSVLADARFKPEQAAVISFSADVVAAVKKELPELKAYWIVSLGTNEKKPKKVWTPEELIAKARDIKADGLDLSADAQVSPEYIKKAVAAKLPVYVWTVNDPDLARQMIEAGAIGITTDRPGWLRDAVAR